MQDLIKIVQLPVIEEHLRSLKQEIEQRTQQVTSLICTDETLSEVKSVRADLNKEFAELEEQRKTIKNAIMQPYEQFETVYKECVSNCYKNADSVLKSKIADVESALKSECRERLEQYFEELCGLESTEFLKFEQIGLNIDMASARAKTPKKLMGQIKEFVQRVSGDVKTISSMENDFEILTEYKQTLNLSQAISVVNQRKERIEHEKQLAEECKQAQEVQEQAVKKVEAVAPPIVEPPVIEPKRPEKMFSCTFKVVATKQQLLKLKDFMNMEGIKYE